MKNKVVIRYRAYFPESLLSLVMEFKKENKLRDRLTAFWILATSGIKLWETSPIIQEAIINEFKNKLYYNKCRMVVYPYDEATKAIDSKLGVNEYIKKVEDVQFEKLDSDISSRFCIITLCGLLYWKQSKIEKKANIFSYNGFKFDISRFNYEKFQESLSIIDLTIKNKGKLLKAAKDMEKYLTDLAMQHFKKLGIRYLYKYKEINTYSDSLIEKSQIWFSKPSDLNDPFECNPIVDKNIIDKSRLLEIRENTSITCFSNVNNEVLLWAHYADSHKGVCFEFDIYEDPMFFFEILPVSYLDNIPKITSNDLNEKGDLVTKLYLSKTKAWSYEQEFRLVHHKGETFMRTKENEENNYSLKLEFLNNRKQDSTTFKKQALKSIIFGYRTSKKNKRHIKSIIKKNNFKHIKFKESILSYETAGLSIEQEI